MRLLGVERVEDLGMQHVSSLCLPAEVCRRYCFTDLILFRSTLEHSNAIYTTVRRTSPRGCSAEYLGRGCRTFCIVYVYEVDLRGSHIRVVFNSNYEYLSRPPHEKEDMSK
jgi:hypothetical protein